MSVKLVLLLGLWGVALSEGNIYLNEDDPLVIKSRYETAAADLSESLAWLEVMIKKCMRKEVTAVPNHPGQYYGETCIGKYNSLLRSVYVQKLRRVKKFFVAYVVKNLDPFRTKYEDEILYLIFLLNFHITRDLDMKRGLEAAQKTVRFQVRPRRFQALLTIVEEFMTRFFDLQTEIGATKRRILAYLHSQTEQLEAANQRVAMKLLEDDVDATALT